jgi:hypothetical protein
MSPRHQPKVIKQMLIKNYCQARMSQKSELQHILKKKLLSSQNVPKVRAPAHLLQQVFFDETKRHQSMSA